MTARATALLAILCPTLAAAQTPTPAPAEAAASPAPPAATWRRSFSAQAGWGYYEALHVGASYHPTERSAFSLFAGYGLAEKADLSAGVAFGHHLFGRVKGVQPGWNLKLVYWRQSDDAYDWTNLSIVLGLYLAKDLGPRLRVALDAGAALTGALESDRKQNLTFGAPERWNGSVCLEISYRLGAG